MNDMRQPDDPGPKLKGVVFKTDLHLVRRRERPQPKAGYLPSGVFAHLSAPYTVIVDGEAITVPEGFATDLASVPRRLRGIVSIDRGIEAAVCHDWLYRRQDRTRAQADLIFKRILEATEGPGTVWAMYLGVRLGGRFAWGR